MFADIFVGAFELKAPRLAGKRGLHIFADSIICFRAKDFRNPFADAVSGVQPEPLSIRAVDELVPPLGIPVSDEHRRGVRYEFQLRRALTEGLLGAFAFGDVFGEDDDAADLALGAEPGAYFPLHPFARTVSAIEAVFIRFFDCTRQTAAVSLFPALRNVGEDFVMRPPDDFP